MREPDLIGADGVTKAWEIKKVEDSSNKAWEATVALYMMDVPWAHRVWNWYSISGIHLRDIEGVPPAKKHFPEAEYEIQIMSMDPHEKISIDDLDMNKGFLPFLTPLDLVHQVSGIDDKQCRMLVQDMVVAILERKLSPDQDYRLAWKQAIDATIDHYRKGMHKPV